MSLYSVRCRLRQELVDPRGSGWSEMWHHFIWPDDDTAVAEFAELHTAWNDGAITPRWTCMRADFVQHSLTIFRRDMTTGRATNLGEFWFNMPPLREFETDVRLPKGITAPAVVRQMHQWPSNRTAMMATIESVDPSVRRRIYAGPISPTMLVAKFDLGLGDWFVASLVDPETFDQLEAVNGIGLDTWGEDLQDVVLEHIDRLEERTPNGSQVVVSWKRGIAAPIAQIRASENRADLLSRSPRSKQGQVRTR